MIFDGTEADEIILGSNDPDTIRGLGGNDEIDGAGGNDTLLGGYGDDILVGGEGDDTLNGDDGNDELHGGNGHDLLISQSGFDVLHGGAGNNRFLLTRFSGFGPVTAIGLDGMDSFSIADVSNGLFTIDAGAGNDTVSLQLLAAGSNISLALGAGADVVLLLNQTNNAKITVQDFEAGDAGDRIELATYLQLALQSGYDRVSNIFAAGYARLVQDGADTLVQIDRDAGGATFAWATIITLKNVTAAALTGYNLGGYPPDGTVPAGLSLTGTGEWDRLYGSMSADTIDGLEGNDIVYAGGGDDVVRGGAGIDSLYGHYGNDTLEGGDDGDRLDAGHGNDVLKGDAGDDQLISSASGNDQLDGGAGNDTISISRSGPLADTVTVNAGEDNDRISVTAPSASTFLLDAGSGDDRVSLNSVNGAATVTLGTGADRVVLALNGASGHASWGSVMITDFVTGDAGDILELDSYFQMALVGWDRVTNPFSNGYARMVQDGADALLQISADAAAANFKTVVRFENVSAASFTALNLYGWPADGSPPPGLVLTGTAQVDSIGGTAGADTIDGLAGNDSLSGGQGADTVRGGEGDDSLSGGGGNDLLEGGDGADTIQGEAGDDEIHGGEGDDIIYASVGGDRSWGGGGNDRINIGAVNQEADGGAGNDYFEVWLFDGTGNGIITINGGDGNDVVSTANTGVATLLIDMGSGNDDVFLPYNRNAVVRLGADSDRIAVAGAAWVMPVGVIDVLDFQTGDGGDFFETESLTGAMQALPWGVSPFSAGFMRLVQDGDDTLLQTDLDGAGTQHGWVTSVIFRDTVATAFTPGNLGFGTEGADTLRLDMALPVMAFGAAGNDIFYLGAHFGPDDYLDGGAGLDTVVLQGDYSAGFAFEESSIVEVEYLAVLSGTETSFGGTGTARYDYLLGMHDENLEAGRTLTVYARGLVAGESLTFDGSEETDARFTVLGGAGDDLLVGGALGDLLDGGGGGDLLVGGLGDDVYIVDAASDQVLELAGHGSDEIRTALGSTTDYAAMYTLAANVEKLTGTSATGQGVFLNALDNVAVMGAGADLVVLQEGGDDAVDGGGGDDFLYFGGAFTSGDSANGGAGYDTVGLLGSYSLVLDGNDLVAVEKLALYSSGNPAAPNAYSVTAHDNNVAAGQQLMVVGLSLASNETLVFNGQAETDGSFNIRGGKGSDALTGGAKADQIYGNLGADTLTGGAGNDMFEYYAAAESTALGRDTISDFAAGDRINLLGIDADGNAANGNSAFHFIGGGAFTGAAGQLRVTAAQGGGWLVEGDVDGNGVADLAILVHTQNGYVLGAADFWL